MSQLTELGKLEVEIVSIDDLVGQRGLPAPDFLKVDVEGAELDVLRGLEHHHRGIKRLFVETHGPQLRRDCLAWMQEHGFTLREAVDETALWGDRL